MYLHGVHLARLHENPTFTGLFGQHGLRVIAPQTKRSWWADKICDEFDPQLTAEQHVLRNIVPQIKERWGAEPPRIALLGTSMGGQGALRFAFKHPNTFPIAVAMAPAIDYQIRYDDPEEETIIQMYPDAEAARQDTATLHVHPLNWPRNVWFSSDPNDLRWHESAQRLHMKMSALGIPHETDLETEAGGHSWDYYNHMAPRALQFIVDRLEQERRRV
ncbi:MAG: alpha/beta hydrolase [Planctomycetes bacterium]|nr:alpha/beta hydrolase [Planctomycetota bacterium]